jgi:hypothetical protein
MDFEIIGTIGAIETIAIGRSIRIHDRLVRDFGPGRWRKMKGTATIRLRGGATRRVELHWYEAHGVGKRKMKIKCYLD